MTINPVSCLLTDFVSNEEPKVYNSLAAEDLKGAELIDNLILLKYTSLQLIQTVLKKKYDIDFVWIKMDPTPSNLKSIADKYSVFLERRENLICYVPLDKSLNLSEISIDIPDATFEVKRIAACNYRAIHNKLRTDIISSSIANFRPLLVFRRLVYDCIISGGTDIHLESYYLDKQPAHAIRYRVKRVMTKSRFSIDYDMMRRVVQAVVSKLSRASSVDLDSSAGITTSVADIFQDGTCDLRVTGSKTSAGLYVVIAIQNVTTTTKKLDELGFPKGDIELLNYLAGLRTGLTLVTGEMRSGKNTTIFAMLNQLINDPIRIIEYSNPIENRMSFPQIDYYGDIEVLEHLMTIAKKEDIDIAVLNEIPNAEVAFAVRDLVNSAIGVITTTHLSRAWHLPYKLQEFFGKDYKTIISQINGVVNHKMFRRVKCPNMQRRTLNPDSGSFERRCHIAGVRQFFVVPEDETPMFELQPLTEILVFNDAEKSAMLNYEELFKVEEMLKSKVEREHQTLEHKLADYINRGICLIDEMRSLV